MDPHSHVLIFVGSNLLAVAGQLLDSETTVTALRHGLTEGNTIAAKLQVWLGLDGFSLAKSLGLPIGCVVLFFTVGWGIGTLAALIFAGTGFLAGIPNYRLLKSKGIPLF